MLGFKIKGRHTPETLEAERGVMLFTCEECGRTQRRELETRDGLLDVYAPDNDCIGCGGNMWLFCQDSLQLMRLNGHFGWKSFFLAFWAQIKTWWALKKS